VALFYVVSRGPRRHSALRHHAWHTLSASVLTCDGFMTVPLVSPAPSAPPALTAPTVYRFSAPRHVQSVLPAWSLWMIVGAITLGVVLRLYQFTAGASLWLDELAIANNLADRSLWSLLTQPLAYAQVAPPGFILVEKLMYELFGANDHALRVYSLVSGIGALGAIALVAVRLGLRETAWVAPFLLALGGPFIFQSVQVKPYAGDVFLSLALVAVALRLGADPNARRGWPIALGMLAPWFSYATAFTLAGIGLALLLTPRNRRHAPVVALWGLSAAAALLYATVLVDRGTAATLHTWWSRDSFGFPTGIADIIPWSLTQIRAHLWSDVGLRGVSYWLGVVGIGAFLLWRRNRFAFAAIVGPVLAALCAALLQRYPVGGRVSQWLAALLILLVATAAAGAARALQSRAKLARLALLPGLAVAALPLVAFRNNHPPYRIEDVKPVLAAISRAHKPQDLIYVYPGAWHAFRYYGAQSGIPAARVVYGRCSARSSRDALAALDSMRGRARVWVLFSHVTKPSDRELVLGYLDRIGIRRQSVSAPTHYKSASSSVDAHLYDLSDPKRLQSASAGTYPVSQAETEFESTLCSVGMVPALANRPSNDPGGDGDRD
jgi:hypothetical protein